jgi:hypothetical protein
MSTNLTTLAQQNVTYDFRLSHTYYGRVVARNSSLTGSNQEIVYETWVDKNSLTNNTFCYGKNLLELFFIYYSLLF